MEALGRASRAELPAVDGEDEAAAMQEVVSLFERRFDEDA